MYILTATEFLQAFLETVTDLISSAIVLRKYELCFLYIKYYKLTML